MSKEQKSNQAAINIYAILDNEMSRMHSLMQAYLALPKETTYSSSYGGLSSTNSLSSHAPVPAIYKRIIEMQDLMLKALVAHDEVIQEKVAELALMGNKDEN